MAGQRERALGMLVTSATQWTSQARRPPTSGGATSTSWDMPDPKPSLCYLQPTAPRLVPPLSRNPGGSLVPRNQDSRRGNPGGRVRSVCFLLQESSLLFYWPQVKVASSGFSSSRRLSRWLPPDEPPTCGVRRPAIQAGSGPSPQSWVGHTVSPSRSSPHRYLHHLKEGMYHCLTM